MRLYRVELRRLLARRFTRLAIVLLIAVLGLVVFTAAHNSHRVTAADRAAAQQQVDQLTTQLRADCERAQKGGASTPDKQQFQGQDCAHLEGPGVDDVMQFHEFSFHIDVPFVSVGVTVLLAAFGFLVGASFIGAEWGAGTMSGLLLWESRRGKIFGTKLAALWTFVLVAGAASFAATLACLWVVADRLGNTTGVTAAYERSLGLEVARGLGVALAAAAIGFALAYATRLTAAAIGVAFAYMVGGEIGMHAFSVAGTRWLFSTNLAAWMLNGFDLPLGNTCTTAGPCVEKIQHVHLWEGGVFLGAIPLVLLIVAGVVFRRRDVT
jgi:ABC-2 type transport system permease protein